MRHPTPPMAIRRWSVQTPTLTTPHPYGAWVAGDVDALPLIVDDVGARQTGSISQGYPSLEVTLMDASGACDEYHGNPASSRALRLYVFNARDQQGVGPGTYLTPGPNGAGPTVFAGIFWHDFNATCSDRQAQGTGTVTLTDVSSTSVSGSFDVTLDAWLSDAAPRIGHLSGSFKAPVCAASRDDGGISVGRCM